MTEADKQTEEKIFDAATDVFIEKGMDGATNAGYSQSRRDQ